MRTNACIATALRLRNTVDGNARRDVGIQGTLQEDGESAIKLVRSFVLQHKNNWWRMINSRRRKRFKRGKTGGRGGGERHVQSEAILDEQKTGRGQADVAACGA